MSDPAECPRPHLSADAARWLLAVTGPLTVRLDHPHAMTTTAMAAAVRAELQGIVAAAAGVEQGAEGDVGASGDGGEQEVHPQEPDGE